MGSRAGKIYAILPLTLWGGEAVSVCLRQSSSLYLGLGPIIWTSSHWQSQRTNNYKASYLSLVKKALWKKMLMIKTGR